MIVLEPTLDVLDSPYIPVIPVNTVGVMGRGLALDFRRRHPDAYQDYVTLCQQRTLVIGRPRLHQHQGGSVVFFPTKRSWTEPSRLEWIEQGLQHIVVATPETASSHYAVPRLGCGLGKLDWEDVYPLIERYLGPLPNTWHISSR